MVHMERLLIRHASMLFHTAMIILHRPPRHLFSKPGIAESEDVEICYESLQAMLRLMKTYSRFYQYSALPLDFVHTLSVTAGTLLMKRFLENAQQEDTGIARAMQTILDAMDAIKYTWPCIVEIKESVAQAMEAQPAAQQEMDVRDTVLDFGILVDFGAGAGGESDPAAAGHAEDFQISDADIGLLLDENFSMDQFSFQDPLTGQTLTTDDIT